MPPEGKWLNPGDSTLCTFDVSAMSMDNIAKLYIMIATPGYSGTIYFDNFTTDKGVVATFNSATELFTREGVGAVAYVTDLALVGGGASSNAVKRAPRGSSIVSPVQIAVRGSTVLVSAENAGNLNVDVFDLQGHCLANLNKGSFAAGTRAYTLNNLAKGMYIIRAAGSFGTVDRQIILK
jgi:hypothetical protein